MDIFQTAGGGLIYRIRVHEFPGLVGNVYLVVFGKYRVLIDVGSGFGESNTDLEQGLLEISDIRREDCNFANITHIFITHGHIDHYGGLTSIKKKTDAKVCIHELDRRIVTHHKEKLTLAAYRLEEFLNEAGIVPEELSNLLDLYKITKSMYQSVEVEISYEAIGMELGPFKFIHVPGHCAGHVAIQLHDVLFSGDHVLEKTSPHQAPEQITISTGLDTYLNSLEIVRSIAKNVKLTLGGHEDPIFSLVERIDEIRSIHLDRLSKILKYLCEPHTVADISKYLFGEVNGYTILLALEETGAHVEYLYQRGYLEIRNINDLEDRLKKGPFHYLADCREIKNI
jgi:glyoxylase-like metal-dependent hydrolase (beta-lactamase superfamily II)